MKTFINVGKSEVEHDSLSLPLVFSLTLCKTIVMDIATVQSLFCSHLFLYKAYQEAWNTQGPEK